jgi:hypothetical protein
MSINTTSTNSLALLLLMMLLLHVTHWYVCHRSAWLCGNWHRSIHVQSTPWPNIPTTVVNYGCSYQLAQIELASTVNVDELEQLLRRLKHTNKQDRLSRFKSPDLASFNDLSIRDAQTALSDIAPRYHALLAQHLHANPHESVLFVHNVPQWHAWQPIVVRIALVFSSAIPLLIAVGIVQPLVALLGAVVLVVALCVATPIALLVNNILHNSIVLTDRSLLLFGTGNRAVNSGWNNVQVIALNQPPQDQDDSNMWCYSIDIAGNGSGAMFLGYWMIRLPNTLSLVSYVLQCWLQCVSDNESDYSLSSSHV